MYKLILVSAKLEIGQRLKNRADWEKCIKGGQVGIGL